MPGCSDSELHGTGRSGGASPHLKLESMVYDAVVIGAGLAGCASAMQLARHGHRVLLLEKKIYPVHKLCGEFLSTEVQALFKRLGVLESVLAAGTRQITRVVVTAPGGSIFHGTLPGTALGLSRYRLDSILCGEAQRMGVELHTGEEVRGISGCLGEHFSVTTDEGTYETRLVVGAFGKRSTLDRKLNRPFLRKRAGYLAFKAHYAGTDLGDAIELHAFPGGYCGLSHVEEGLVNACWISTENAFKASGRHPEHMIRTCFGANDILRRRFQALEKVSDSFTAISQISFAQKGTFEAGVCMVGDTVGMIAPLCGDGMAMALRSAELAAPLLSAYLKAELDAGSLMQRYRQAWDREFRMRMRLGRIAHYGFSVPFVARTAIRAFNVLPILGEWLIRGTRGTPEPLDGGGQPLGMTVLNTPH